MSGEILLTYLKVKLEHVFSTEQQESLKTELLAKVFDWLDKIG